MTFRVLLAWAMPASNFFTQARAVPEAPLVLKAGLRVEFLAGPQHQVGRDRTLSADGDVEVGDKHHRHRPHHHSDGLEGVLGKLVLLLDGFAQRGEDLYAGVVLDAKSRLEVDPVWINRNTQRLFPGNTGRKTTLQVKKYLALGPHLIQGGRKVAVFIVDDFVEGKVEDIHGLHTRLGLVAGLAVGKPNPRRKALGLHQVAGPQVLLEAGLALGNGLGQTGLLGLHHHLLAARGDLHYFEQKAIWRVGARLAGQNLADLELPQLRAPRLEG